MTRQKRCKFVALLRGKQVFSWRAKNSYIWCINTWKTGFLMTPPKTKCAFDALLHFVAGFLMTRQKLLNLMQYYVKKQVFSWHAKKLQICCIITWKSRVSHDAPKNSYIWCIYTWKSRFSHDTTEKVYIWFIISYRSRFSHGVPKTNI